VRDTSRDEQRKSQDARTRHRDDALDRAIERFQDERASQADQRAAEDASTEEPPAPASPEARSADSRGDDVTTPVRSPASRKKP